MYPRFGEEVCVWIKLRKGAHATADELRTFCKERLAYFKVPRYVKFVEDFPLTVTGKVQKYRIREITIEELGLGAGHGNVAFDDTLRDNEATDVAGGSLMKDRKWMRAGLALLLMLVAWVTLCGVGSAQEKPQLAWYGYVKLDAAWDQGLMSEGNYARWVVSGDVVPEHSHFNMTARQTRLGFNIAGKSGKATLSGRWESDFYGGSGAASENRNALQVRLAYVDVTWPSGWSILAGQAADVISPLVPGTLNYTVAWWGGNIGYRRPQLRVTRRIKMSGNKELRFEGAASRSIGDEAFPADPGDTGADAGYPTFQGLLGLTAPVSGRSLGLGVYGHRGDENFHKELGGDPQDLHSSSVGTYLTLPMGSKATLSAEAWSGLNMDNYMGGINQGVRIAGTKATEVGARGGWAELALRSAHGAQVNFGYSVDDPDDADLAKGARKLNRAMWTTLTHEPGGGLRYGVELSRWETGYLQAATGKSWRVQTSIQFSF